MVGVLNVTPGSSYKGSVTIKDEDVREAVLRMISEGCDVIDVGARSTAPYLQTEISVDGELRRV